MSKGNTFETELLEHILNNAAIALIGDASGLQPSAADGNLYIALHTGDPGEGGNQTTSEANYTDYARVAIARTGAAWTVTNNSAVNAAPVTFPQASAGSSTVTWFSVGTAPTSTGKILYRGELSASLAVTAGVTPEFAAGELEITED